MSGRLSGVNSITRRLWRITKNGRICLVFVSEAPEIQWVTALGSAIGVERRLASKASPAQIA